MRNRRRVRPILRFERCIDDRLTPVPCLSRRSHESNGRRRSISRHRRGARRQPGDAKQARVRSETDCRRPRRFRPDIDKSGRPRRTAREIVAAYRGFVRPERPAEVPRSARVAAEKPSIWRAHEHLLPGRGRELRRRSFPRRGRRHGSRKGAASRLRALLEPSSHRVDAASLRNALRHIEERAAAFASPLCKLSLQRRRGKPGPHQSA